MNTTHHVPFTPRVTWPMFARRVRLRAHFPHDLCAALACEARTLRTTLSGLHWRAGEHGRTAPPVSCSSASVPSGSRRRPVNTCSLPCTCFLNCATHLVGDAPLLAAWWACLIDPQHAAVGDRGGRTPVFLRIAAVHLGPQATQIRRIESAKGSLSLLRNRHKNR